MGPDGPARVSSVACIMHNFRRMFAGRPLLLTSRNKLLSPLRCTWAINRLRVVAAVVSRGDLMYQVRDQQDKYKMSSCIRYVSVFHLPTNFIYVSIVKKGGKETTLKT